MRASASVPPRRTGARASPAAPDRHLGDAGLSLREARVALAAGLRQRRAEFEQAVATRVFAISAPSEVADPDYLEGLRASLGIALEYAIAAVLRGEQAAPPVPTALLAQARLAARNGVSLDTVLRRYFAGYSLLGEVIYAEADESGIIGGTGLRDVLRGQAAVFDRLIAAVTEEHSRESATRLDSVDQRLAERVERLLAGEPIDATQLGYDLDAHHLGLVADGPGAAAGIRELVATLGCRLLLVRPEAGGLWAWLGSRRRLDREALQPLVRSVLPPSASVSIGEHSGGLAGWRLTHRQARAAMTVAQRTREVVTWYRDVALLASALQDELLATSLRRLYIVPLQLEADGGGALRETLRAYFAADRQISSAAAALGVKRHTVTNRLRTVEDRIGRPLGSCSQALDMALRLQALDPQGSTD